jgi:uncharacterized phage protein gp47/JayE
MSWYKVKIFNKEVNWASVTASGLLFIGLELWRRKYIAKQIKKDIKIALKESEQQIEENTSTLLDNILDRI